MFTHRAGVKIPECFHESIRWCTAASHWAASASRRTRVDFFDKNGYLLLENDFTPAEIRRFQRELQRLRSDPELLHRPEVITEPDSEAVRSIFRPHAFSPLFDRIGRSTRLLDIVQQLLGGPVYIHQSRLNIKPAFVGRSFSWHSDFETWHVEDGLPRMRCLSCSIFLTDNTRHNGALYVMPGSHRDYVSCSGVTPENNYRTSLQAQRIGTPDPDMLGRLSECYDLADTCGPAGSLLIFDGNVLHCSPDNFSPWPRVDLFFAYNSVQNRPRAPFCGLAPRPAFLGSHDTRPLRPVELPTREIDETPLSALG